MELIGLIWDTGIVHPLTNALLLLHLLLFSNFGLAIIALTFVIRGITYPLTIRQLRQTQRLQGLQTKIKAIQERHKADPKRRSQEVMRLYREEGVNPLGCLGPFGLQLPILLGLFFTIRNTIGLTPEGLAGLAAGLYSWLPILDSVVPVDRDFLWLDLGERDPFLVLPILSGVTMWVQQKMTMTSSGDPTQASQQRMMLWMFPMVFVVISVNFFSGLVLYWVASNVIQIVMQFFVTGWGGLRPARTAPLPPAPTVAASLEPSDTNQESSKDDRTRRRPRVERQDGRRSDRDRNPRIRRRPRRNRDRRP